MMAEDALIAVLSADLRPVRRLRTPAVRAFWWVAAVLVLGAVLMSMADMGAVRARLAGVPDMWWATVGAVLTAVAAAVAALQLSVPGRSGWWVALPVPAAAVWLGASGWGCLRGWAAPGLEPPSTHDLMVCTTFIVLVSVPLSALLLLLVRRACPLWPGRIAAMGGLAAAAAAASLLTLFHPHDASAADVLVHAVAVGVVVLVSRWVGMRFEGR